MKKTTVMILFMMLALMTILIPETAVCSSEPDETQDIAAMIEPTFATETTFPDAADHSETAETLITAPNPSVETDVGQASPPANASGDEALQDDCATPTDLYDDPDAPEYDTLPAYVLPATGGTGVGHYVIGGMVLILAGEMLLRKKR